ncbi:MAG: efflux RND transporter periplasmic adaptor subunit, partial [Bacteroidales bacterium]
DGLMYDNEGTIDAVSGIINSATGAIGIRAKFNNPKRVLRSGGTGSIVFPYDKTNCIVIPQAATYEIQDKVFVYKVVDGKAVSTAVLVFGINDGKEYIVELGLNEGDNIIAEGAGLVREGTPVATNIKTNNKEEEPVK